MLERSSRRSPSSDPRRERNGRQTTACNHRTVIEIRRQDDDELCGYVEARGGDWHAITIFGGRLGVHDRRDDAERQVLEIGLASLAERWTLTDVATGEEQVVCIQEASPSSLTLALGYYSLPGVPSLTLSRDDVTGGRWQLDRT